MGSLIPTQCSTPEECKSKAIVMQLLDKCRFHFGFYHDDIYSERLCRTKEWDHVAFVYNEKGGTNGKIIVVNGKITANTEDSSSGSKPYKGNEMITLGKDPLIG